MVETNWQGSGDPTTPEFRQQIPLSQTNYKLNIDDPAGWIIRFTGEGMAVYMSYREPGTYYNDHGRKVPEQFAMAAGFETEYWGKIRRREEAKAATLRSIDAEFADGLKQRTVWEHGEYRVVEVARDLYNIQFEDGTVLNTRGPVSLEVAQRRFEELAGVEVSTLAAESQPFDAGVVKAAPKQAK